MRALEEVALSYDQKAEEAAKSDDLQKKLEEAEQKSTQLENVKYVVSLLSIAINNAILIVLLYPLIIYNFQIYIKKT